MNQRSPGFLLSKAIDGFVQFKTAEALSPNTLTAYTHILNQWLTHVGDMDVHRLDAESVRGYLAWLRTDYKPKRFNGSDQPLSPKSLRNVWITLSAFFKWGGQELGLDNPMRNVPAPRFQEAPVEPLAKEEIAALLKASEFSREADTSDRRRFVMRRATGKRDRVIILMLLDTGLRASELCALKVGDVDIKTGRVEVKHGRTGGAKGGKGRTVFIGKSTRRALWLYLAEREDGDQADESLFLGKFHRPLNKTALRHLLVSLGKKANVKNCHPHRFRHTFAITYLRSGGDVFTLQSLLGHATLDMVQHYARIAEIDIALAHQRASPADNWRL